MKNSGTERRGNRALIAETHVCAEVLRAPTRELARTVAADVTIEAEYGDWVAEGRLYTAAHHQPSGSRWAGRHVGGPMPSPCNDEAIPVLGAGGVVFLSHLDLDSFGGALRALGARELFAPGLDATAAAEARARREFWDLAEFVDVRGPHRLSAREGSAQAVARLRAFWAWSKANGVRFPRDSISDVTAAARGAGSAIAAILRDDPELLRAGEALGASQAELNRRTFHRFYVVQRSGRSVLARKATAARDFCNHLYDAPDGWVGDAVVAWNTETGAITISLADPVPGVSCREIVQALWGPAAGAHDGIAGSPRGRQMAEEDWQEAIDAAAERLGRAPSSAR
jgi:hypothetical protein